MGHGRYCLLLLILLTCLPAARGQSPAPLPPVNLGFTSFMDGAPPAGPGLYLSQYFQYYGAGEIVDDGGDPLPLPNPKLDVWASLTQLIYLWDIDLGHGAKPAIDVLIPAISTDLDFSTPVPVPAAGSGGLGDILIGPAIQFAPIMGSKGPLFVHRVEAQFILPTGDYSPDDQVNAGSNFFSFSPYWAGTFFFGPKTNASFRAHYLWNDKNDDPFTILGPGVQTTRAGEAFHINFTMSRECVRKRLRLGINGYYLRQTTDAEINGIDVPGTREAAFGIGPGALLACSPKQFFFLNSYWEDGNRNRPEGFRLTMRYVHKF